MSDMGREITLQCRECGYEASGNLGVGFLFPVVYQETMKDARAGKYGETIRQFLLDHPDGTLNTENVFLQCTGCGNLAFGKDLSMYIRKSDVPRREHGRWSVAVPSEGADYVSPAELERENTYEFAAWGNTCSKCGKPMKPISEEHLLRKKAGCEKVGDQTVVCCPKCKEPLYIAGMLMWD